jgi:hypothetical protein
MFELFELYPFANQLHYAKLMRAFRFWKLFFVLPEAIPGKGGIFTCVNTNLFSSSILN